MKLIKIILILTILNVSNSFADNLDEFNQWKLRFKQVALANNISKTTIDKAISSINNMVEFMTSINLINF